MPRILVIDDDEPTRELLQDVLADEGYAVSSAVNPQAAVDLLGREQFDLVLTDLFGTSYQTVPMEHLRRIHAAAAGAPVVVLTGRTSALSLPTPELEIAAVMIKPFELDVLLEQVRGLVKGAE